MQLLQKLFARWSEAKIQRLFECAQQKDKIGDTGGAILDYSSIIDMSNAPPEWIAKARVHRAASHWKNGDVREAFDDLDTVLEMPDAPHDLKKLATQNKHVYLGRH
jgi:hypothetical protein